LQKVLYFIHGKYLLETGSPLIDGYFEAWPYGPVHPLIYETFKDFGSGPLRVKATKRNIVSGQEIDIEEPTSFEIVSFIAENCLAYLKFSPGRLVDLSHAKNSPWDVVSRQDQNNRCYGMRITNNTIKEYFKYHKISVSDQSISGDHNEESPPY